MTADQLHGFDVARAAEVLVERPDGRGRRGSGYRIATELVLTAAHTLAGAGSIMVRFDADQREREWTSSAGIIWSDDDLDVAILVLRDLGGREPVPVATFGRIGQRRAVIDVHAVGFPLWKVRSRSNGHVFRDMHDAAGTVAVLSNRREGTLEISTTPPAADPDPDASPWAAMSGAAVWASGRIVGVVKAHHRREGLGRLTAARCDRFLRLLPPGIRETLGVSDADGLLDVVPRPMSWRIRSGYREQIRDIAPADGLHGREAELDAMAAFCFGDDTYLWWRAGPWAGKTALMATFALDPPAGVEVVSFFVTARLAAQNDSAAFTDAVLEQLSAIMDETLPPSLGPGAADRHRRALLHLAAERVKATGRRLVLLVDGLDEDVGTVPGSRLASIASLLPKSPEDGLRVIVASRPRPPIPPDVAPDHPLRRCRQRTLTRSTYAADIAQRAQHELAELLSGDAEHYTVIGLIAAAGGGLTVSELEELTELPRHRLDHMLGGVFGRTIAGRAGYTSLDPHQVFLFTHETLRVGAMEQLGLALQRFRDRIHTWATIYQERGWPASTPQYLMRGYTNLLVSERDVGRLVALATDSQRHDRMLDTTGGDAAALAEVKAAHDLLLEQSDPDLLAAARLGMRRQDLGSRNANIPVGLPAIWATLRQFTRAETLAGGITDPYRLADTLAALAMALARADPERTGEVVDRAHAALPGIADPYRRSRLLTSMSAALAVAGDRRRAAALAREAEIGASLFRKREDRDAALRNLARTLAESGDHGRARAVALQISEAAIRAQALAVLVSNLADTVNADDLEQISDAAEHLARGLVDAAPHGPEVYDFTDVIVELAVGIAGAGGLDRARNIVATVDHGPDALAALATVALAKGEIAIAESIADDIADVPHQIEAFARLATVLDASGEKQRAGHVVDRAIAALSRAATRYGRADSARTLLPLAARLLTRERFVALIREAEAGASALLVSHNDASPLDRLLKSLAALGEDRMATAVRDRSEQARGEAEERKRAAEAEARHRSLRGFDDDPVWYFEEFDSAPVHPLMPKPGPEETRPPMAFSLLDTLLRLSRAMRAQGKPSAAAALVSRFDDLLANCEVHERRTLTIRLVEATAEAGDPEYAERLAGAVDFSRYDADDRTDLVKVLLRHCRTDVATDLAARVRAHGMSSDRPEVIASWAAVLAESSFADLATELALRSETVARSIINVAEQADEISELAKLLADAGEFDDAESIAHAVPDDDRRAGVVIHLAAAVAATGDSERAQRLSGIISGEFRQADALIRVSDALTRSSDYDNALAVARKIGNAFRRSIALAAVVTGMARAGYVREGMALTREITDTYRFADAMIELAAAYARAGDTETATQLTRRITDPFRRQAALSRIAVALADSGRTDPGETVARGIDDAVRRDTALASVAVAVAATGATDRATAIACDVAAPDVRLRAIARLIPDADAAHRPRLVDLAVRTARPQVDARRCRSALLQVIAVSPPRVAAEAVRVAAEAVAQISDPAGRLDSLADLARAVAASGDRIAAVEIARGITEDAIRDRTLAHIVASYAKADDVDGGRSLMMSISDPLGKCEAVAALLECERDGDLISLADRTARDIRNPWRQAEMFLRLAHLTSGPQRQRFIAQAFAVGRWHVPLKLLVSADREALRRIAAERMTSLKIRSDGKPHRRRVDPW